jgi:hypothetical protein
MFCSASEGSSVGSRDGSVDVVGNKAVGIVVRFIKKGKIFIGGQGKNSSLKLGASLLFKSCVGTVKYALVG